MIREVVSHCPVCRAPIYGPRQVDDAQFALMTSVVNPALSRVPFATFSCECRARLLQKLDLQNQALARALLQPPPPLPPLPVA